MLEMEVPISFILLYLIDILEFQSFALKKDFQSLLL